jgi:hypothetical protein
MICSLGGVGLQTSNKLEYFMTKKEGFSNGVVFQSRYWYNNVPL